MEPYLNERSADGATSWVFHRQMGEARWMPIYRGGEPRAMIHAGLAGYFAAQPLFIGQEDKKTANLRKLSELPYQQTHGALWEGLYKTLTDFDFLEAKCTYSDTIHAPEGEKGRKIYGGVYELIEDYRRALSVYPVEMELDQAREA